MKIILASKSPRRKELMDLAGFEYEILVSGFDEKVDQNLSLEEQSKEIAYGKARDIFEHTQGDRAVIGSDTLVVLGGKQYGKPRTEEEAVQFLQELQGKKHTVYTALSVIIEKQGAVKQYKELHRADVYVKPMTMQEIEAYVGREMPLDKAGAYAIQTSFIVFIEKIVGDYAAIVGLPIGRVYEILKENEIL